MVTEVKIAEFKSRLSEHLRSVRQGNEIVIKDRETPVARLVPCKPPGAEFVTKPPTRTLRELDEMMAVQPRKRINLKPGVLDKAIRETKMDWFERWMRSKSTSTRR